MSIKDRIQTLCKQKGITSKELESQLRFGKGYISKIDKSNPTVDKLQQIANFLNVPLNDLMNSSNDSLVSCKECGLMYDSSYKKDIEEHAKQHTAWLKATNKFGELYCYAPEREKLKAEYRNLSHDLSLPIAKRIDAQLKVLRCLFSRSIEDCEFSLDHVPFNTYVAMMLNNDSYKKSIENDVYEALCKKYGTQPGIDFGSTYRMPAQNIQTLAAHKEGDFTPEELQKIEDYKKLLIAARSKG